MVRKCKRTQLNQTTVVFQSFAFIFFFLKEEQHECASTHLFSTEITERRVMKKMALDFHVAKLKLSQIIVPQGLLAQSVACVCHREHVRSVKPIPSFASCTISFCSISSRVFSLFSSFCIMLAMSTMAPLYTIKLPDSLVSALMRVLGAGRRLRLPEREKNIRHLCNKGIKFI